MDTLDEQLAQLKLINSRTLSPKNATSAIGSDGEGVTAGVVSAQIPGSAAVGGLNLKKVGPAVPPKPFKKNLPQVPQSSAVKQLGEPLYSTRLQAGLATNATSLDTGNSGVAAYEATIPSLSRKTNYGPVEAMTTTTSHHHQQQPIYSNMKMTLDNAAILEQQLEVLEHHKRQLEKKGMLPNQQKSRNLNGIGSESITYEQFSRTPHLYSNVQRNPTDLNIANDQQSGYCDLMQKSNSQQQQQQQQQKQDLVYSNVNFGGNSDELPPPPPLDTSATFELAESSFNYHHQASEEDELPPPPSPVSSSYSELRRATENFPQMPKYPMQAVQNPSSGSISGVDLGGDMILVGGNNGQIGNSATGQNITNNASNSQRTYANTIYHTNDYSTYVPSSQSSSAYESIYEPINPRPPSQLSSRSNYSIYTSYVNGPQSGSNTPISNNSVNQMLGNNAKNINSGTLSSHKEAEVEVLTDLLVKSMDNGQDVDSYGICVKCCERVVGENSGCTAMEQIYHISCFTCSQCQINLQGKPFYALEGKPYCEDDYLNTLEKCSVCMKPILERILRATGKPYHPACFCCVVCGNSLDGIPFTVDATNQNYCIEDFHKKFAPRCCVCHQPIMPEPGQEETVRVVALDRSFHFECYKCEDCGLLLSSEAEGRGCYPLDDHVLCKSCNAKRVQALTSRMTTEL